MRGHTGAGSLKGKLEGTSVLRWLGEAFWHQLATLEARILRGGFRQSLAQPLIFKLRGAHRVCAPCSLVEPKQGFGLQDERRPYQIRFGRLIVQTEMITAAYRLPNANLGGKLPRHRNCEGRDSRCTGSLEAPCQQGAALGGSSLRRCPAVRMQTPLTKRPALAAAGSRKLTLSVQACFKPTLLWLNLCHLPGSCAQIRADAERLLAGTHPVLMAELKKHEVVMEAQIKQATGIRLNQAANIHNLFDCDKKQIEDEYRVHGP